MEVSELQNNDSLEDAFSSGNLLQFYASLPILNLPNIKTFTKKLSFGSTYICEQAFLVMKYQKNKQCFHITNEYLHVVMNFIYLFQSRYPQISW
jgi:hypothetical protein